MNFHQLCEDFLSNLAENLEASDLDSRLDIEYLDGILEIKIIASNKTFVINRNAGNQKIWYSSPFLGADYFSFDEKTSQWLNDKGLELASKLKKELTFLN